MSTLTEAEVSPLSFATQQAPSREQELVARSQQGDTGAFEQLFYLYQMDVYRTAYSLMGNEEDARDMTQEAFVRAFQSLSKFRRQASFRTWITRITTNLCLDELRRRKRQGTDSLEEHPTWAAKAASPETALDNLIQRERHALLHELLNRLPEKYRVLIVLRDIQGHSYAEIADILDLSLSKVKSRLHEARQELKRLGIRRNLF